MAEAPNVAAMILYHFTTIGNLGMIRAHGLSRGRVELSHDPQDYMNAISLTASPLPVGLGLDLGPDELTEMDRIRIFERTGILPAEGARFADSRAVRITVELERDDPALIQWRDFRTRILPSRRVELGGTFAEAGACTGDEDGLRQESFLSCWVVGVRVSRLSGWRLRSLCAPPGHFGVLRHSAAGYTQGPDDDIVQSPGRDTAAKWGKATIRELQAWCRRPGLAVVTDRFAVRLNQHGR